MAAQFTLGKEERLKSRKAIEKLFEKGQRFTLPPYRIFYRIQDGNGQDAFPVKAGFGASSRNFPTAVARNRIKRLGREAWRLEKLRLQHLLQQHQKELHVFLIFTGKEIESFERVQEAIASIAGKLYRILEGTP